MRSKKITRSCVWAFLVILVLSASAALAESEPSLQPTLYLREGQRYPIEGMMAEKVEIQPPGVATATQTPQGTLLIGQKAGTALLTLEASGQKVSMQVQVRPGFPAAPAVASSRGDLWNEGLAELRRIKGIRLSALGDKVIVQGEIPGRKAYQQILFYARAFAKKLLVLANPAPGVRESLIEQANHLLQANGLHEATVESAGNRFFLEGTVGTAPEVERALELVQDVIPSIENHLPVPIRVQPTISVRVFILELSKQAHQALGLSWPASAPQAIALSPKTAIFSPAWSATLLHLSAEGQARVLAEPMLAVKTGSSAELSAGGEIPLRITGKFENKVTWKHYGLHVNLHIHGVAGKYIRTQIKTSSSQLDEATAVDGIPGIRSNQMNTEIDAIEGQPVLLTGLFQASVAKDIERVPFLGSIPILGELFKSRRFREHESELLVALLPRFGAETARVPLESTRGLEFDRKWRPLD